MNEVEVLVMIKENKAKEVLAKLKAIAGYISQTKVEDVYFYDPKRKNLQPDKDLAIYECFRLRKKGEKNYMTYKVDKFDDNNKWLYSDENEIEVDNYATAKEIILRLGLKELVIVDMTKYYFETELYTIALEIVKNLGAFLEVESKKFDVTVADIANKRKEIECFIKSLDVDASPDLGIGKPELLLKKINWKP